MDAISSSSSQNHSIGNAILVGSAGGAISAGASAYSQSYFIKNKKEADVFISSIRDSRAKLATQGKKPALFLAKWQDSFIKVLKKGKFDSKFVLKNAGIGSAVCAGAYLAYKGLMSLLKND